MGDDGGQFTGGKERLLTASDELFGDRAFSDVTVSEILAKAGVQAPTLYYHFGDKEGLYVEWAKAAFERFGSGWGARWMSGDTLRDLTSFGEAIAGRLGVDLLEVLRSAQALERPESREAVFQAYLRNVHEPLCAVLLSGIERGALVREPVSKMAAAFVLGAMGAGKHCPVPGVSNAFDAAWWARRFLEGFGC